MNTESKGSLLSALLKILKIALLFPIALSLTGVCFMFMWKGFTVYAACLEEGYMAWTYIATNIFEGLWSLTLGMLAWAALLPERFRKIKISTIGWLSLIFMGASVRLTMYDFQIKETFKDANYPSYIESWPVQTLTEEKSCDYRRDKIYLGGYFAFIYNDFRPYANIEVVEDRTFTDRYRIEVRFRGEESELRIYHDEYEEKDSGEYKDNINLWTKEYHSELPARDIAYMYKCKEDLTYSERIAVEKIIIRTAYPEKIDVSEIKGRR